MFDILLYALVLYILDGVMTVYSVNLPDMLVSRFNELVPKGKRSEVVSKLLTTYCEDHDDQTKKRHIRGKFIEHIAYPAIQRLMGKTDPWRVNENYIKDLLAGESIEITVSESKDLLNRLMNETIDGV